MELQKTYTDADFSDSVVPSGTILRFMTATGERYKDSAGAFHDFSSSSGGSISSITFQAPEITDGTVYNLKIDFSASNQFTDVTTVDTTVTADRALFTIFDGTVIVAFPDDGISLPFSQEMIDFDASAFVSTKPYFRFCWNDGTANSLFSYGKLNTIIYK